MLHSIIGFLQGLRGKESTCNGGIWSLGQEDTLEKEMAPHFSMSLGNPMTEDPGGLQSMGS